MKLYIPSTIILIELWRSTTRLQRFCALLLLDAQLALRANRQSACERARRTVLGLTTMSMLFSHLTKSETESRVGLLTHRSRIWSSCYAVSLRGRPAGSARARPRPVRILYTVLGDPLVAPSSVTQSLPEADHLVTHTTWRYGVPLSLSLVLDGVDFKVSRQNRHRVSEHVPIRKSRVIRKRKLFTYKLLFRRKKAFHSKTVHFLNYFFYRQYIHWCYI